MEINKTSQLSIIHKILLGVVFFFFFNKMESYVTITLSTLCNNPDLDRDEISLLMRQETLMEMFYFIEKQQKN